MEDKLFEILDDLNIRETKLLLDKDIELSLDSSTRKRIEMSIKKKTGHYSKNNIHKDKINNILGGILMKKKIALVLCATVILSLSGGGYAYAKTPVAYVSMDINPSVELGVNAFDNVVSVEAYNKDGEKILEGTDLVNTNIDDAVSTVISNAISEGYINEDGSSAIEITTSTDKEKVATELDESLKEVTLETLNNNNVKAEVETEKMAIARRDEARQLGITPGKLNLIQKLQALDSTITVEDYKDSSVKDIQKKTKELRKNNKSNEITTDESTITDANVDAVAEEATLSQKSIELEETKIIEPEKNNKGNAKKEENSNASEEKETTTIIEKQNNGNNSNSQENNNSSKPKESNILDSKGNSNNSKSSKSEESSISDSKDNSSNSNSLKSENSENGNSSSQSKDSNKNKTKAN